MLTAVGSAAVVAFLAVAPIATSGAAHAPHAQKIGIVIRAADRVGPANFALAPGVRVRVTVRNYTHELHTFTVPGLRVSRLILPARGHRPRTTTFSFTAHEWGTFRWHCLICPSGQHGRAHAMGGRLYLIIDPSVLP